MILSTTRAWNQRTWWTRFIRSILFLLLSQQQWCLKNNNNHHRSCGWWGVASYSIPTPPPLPRTSRSSSTPTAPKSPATTTTASTSRRPEMQSILQSYSRRIIPFVVTTAVVFVLSASTTTTTTTSSTICHAACLPGDIHVDCIGVYKVPIDEEMTPYVATPEALKRFAPDVRYVPPVPTPQGYHQAMDILKQQQQTMGPTILQTVAAGQLEEAGLLLLQVLPKLTTSGRVIVQSIQEALLSQQQQQQQSSSSTTVLMDMKVSKLKEQLDNMLAIWGECDVIMGQGLRGDMGVSAVAQLQIISSLKDAMIALDDFIATAVALTPPPPTTTTSSSSALVTTTVGSFFYTPLE